MRRFFWVLFLTAFMACGLGAGAAYWWVNQPLSLSAPTLDLAIENGTSARGVAQQVAKAGVNVNPSLLYGWFRLSRKARLIKAGNYELTAGVTPRTLLQKLVQGDESLRLLTLVEGWSFRQVRAALARAEGLKHDSQVLTDEALMAALGMPQLAPEGRFFPDTYAYGKGTSDMALLARAHQAMQRKLQAAWAQRSPDTPLRSPDELLTLASIVEKETGQVQDRSMIASVFTNRLKIGMMLQTDPTVIYGMGASYNGNLRKVDLQTDTPWNTYTRAGLPPTPIAMPGKSALLAAAAPAPSKSLYFVARGDGSSQFSATLQEHNQAVNKYQRKQ